MPWGWLIASALQFPDVEARDLNGRVVHARDLRGAPVVLALGFSYESRQQVEPWTKAIVRETAGQLPVIVMPVYRGVPGPVRGLVDAAMAAGTPAALKAHVWTTTAFEPLARGLGLPETTKGAAIVLLDGQGAVRHLAIGSPSGDAVRALLDAWRGLKPARS